MKRFVAKNKGEIVAIVDKILQEWKDESPSL
jgi:hypothetical protein